MSSITDFKQFHDKLIAPIPYKFRLQSVKYGKATVVSYIDSRQLQDRLDEVLGSENWQVMYEERKGNLFAGIGIRINGEWVWKYDCGTESNIEKEKGEASDSFKRAGVMWGVGRFLYSLPIITLSTAKHKDKEYPADDKGKILWSADDLNKYCRLLLSKTQNETQNETQSKTSTDPTTMTEKQFNGALARINKGEKDVILNAQKANIFIPPAQLQVLQAAEKNYKPTK